MALVTTATLKTARFQSTIATGTSPLVVASTTLVTNLNADLLDGKEAAAFALLAGAAFTGAVTMATTLGVTGAATLNSLAASSNATIGGTLGVTGATTLSSTLAVTGATTLTGLLTGNGGLVLDRSGASGYVQFKNDGTSRYYIHAGDANQIKFFRGDGSTEDGRLDAGRLLWGNALTTGADSKTIVVDNQSRGGGVAGVNAAGTAATRLIFLDGADNTRIGQTSRALVFDFLDPVAGGLSKQVLAGADGTGPGGVGRALYLAS